jgi:hypothetical protein
LLLEKKAIEGGGGTLVAGIVKEPLSSSCEINGLRVPIGRIDCAPLLMFDAAVRGGSVTMESDSVYFARRAREEHLAGLKASNAARDAHVQLARFYQEAALLLASAEELEYELSLTSLLQLEFAMPIQS